MTHQHQGRVLGAGSGRPEHAGDVAQGEIAFGDTVCGPPPRGLSRSAARYQSEFIAASHFPAGRWSLVSGEADLHRGPDRLGCPVDPRQLCADDDRHYCQEHGLIGLVTAQAALDAKTENPLEPSAQ